MSDDFNVGDVVVCFREPSGWIASDWEPKVGSFYSIAGIDVDTTGVAIIDLREDPSCFSDDGAWEAAAFRKLPRADEQFTEQMRACKPVRVSEPA